MCKIETNASDFEKLKLVYEKVSEHTRFYLAWRQYLLGGYFAIAGAVLYSTYTLFINPNVLVKTYSPYAAYSISLISLFFLLLEERIRTLFMASHKVGVSIEKQMNLTLSDGASTIHGLFDKLDTNAYKFKPLSIFITHTWVIRTLYILCIVLGIYLGYNINQDLDI